MGPIERELRTAPVENEDIYQWAWTCISARSRKVVQDACWSTGDGLLTAGARRLGILPDVLSDAVEFAASEGI
jgi:hypothetical protein